LENLAPDVCTREILSHYLSGPRISKALISRYAREIPHLTALYKYSILPNLYQHAPIGGEVRKPATIITGDVDALVSVEQARRMAALLPNARSMVVIEQGEHLLPFTHDAEVNRAIETFYRSLD
jgi:pimeloyl-ACP methyl ester carboxylesterase